MISQFAKLEFLITGMSNEEKNVKIKQELCCVVGLRPIVRM